MLGDGYTWNCTKCGSQAQPPKINPVTQFAGIGLIVVVIAVCCGMFWSSKQSQEKKVADALKYLASVDEVAWYKIDNDNVFIGFKKPHPQDWNEIIRAAAIHGSRASGTSFSAWAISADDNPKPTIEDSFGGTEAYRGKIVR